MYVHPEDYHEMKEKMSGSMFASDLIAVDLNGAYVPMEVTQDSKESIKEIETANELTRKRFGL